MADSDLLDRLFEYLAGLGYVTSIDRAHEQIRVHPDSRLLENGQPMPDEIALSVPAVEFERAFPELERAGGVLRPGAPAEAAAFGLFDVHISETINSLRIPGKRGFIYRDKRFEPWD